MSHNSLRLSFLRLRKLTKGIFLTIRASAFSNIFNVTISLPSKQINIAGRNLKLVRPGSHHLLKFVRDHRLSTGYLDFFKLIYCLTLVEHKFEPNYF